MGEPTVYGRRRRQCAHGVSRGRPAKRSALLIHNGKVIATDDWIGPVALDPAKAAPAYWIAHGRIQNSSGRPQPGSAALVWGKYKSAKWQYAEEAVPPQFAPDGKCLVTTAARGDGDWNVITVDDKNKEEKRGSGSIFEAAVRPGGHEIAYTIAHLEGGQYWMSHDQKYLVATESLDQRGSKAAGHLYGEDFSSTGGPVYSADGRHIAFKVMNESKMGVVIDDRNDARFNYEYVDEIALKPDGSEAAFVGCTGCTLNAEHGSQVLHGVKATGGKWWVVYGKLRVGEYDLARFPAWSPDGTAIAYAVKRGEKWFVIAGSKQSEACDDVACVVWSNDGRCVWYGCLKGNEVWWCKLDVG